MAWKWLKTMFAGGVKETAESIGSVITQFQAGHLGKKELQLELEKLLHERAMEQFAEAAAELKAKTDINVAELQQGDEYTKRTRPFVIRNGLWICFVLVMLEVAAQVAAGIATWQFTYTTPELAKWFLGIWGSYGSVYAVGRSAQHMWPGNRFSQMTNGDS